jgi:flagellar basal-body rod protein FlgG
VFKGFYNLTSAMLSQGKRLDVIANNMANVSTSGYKEDTYTDSTFREYITSRTGNKDKTNPAEIGPSSYILAPSQVYTNFSQGSLEETRMPLDFAIEGDGFFAVQTQEGIGYTRNGVFALDDEGYLCAADGNRVLSPDEEEIYLGTDKIQAEGNALYTENGGFLGQIGVFSFQDNGALARDAQGYFTGGNAQAAQGTTIHWGYRERSNLDLIGQMTDMITAQRAYQSAAELSRMYDQVMTKAATNIGNV